MEVTTLPPYNILYDSLHGLHLNGVFLRFQIGSPIILKIKTPTILDAHNFLCRPQIERRFEAKI
jgi:hypothetical protein